MDLTEVTKLMRQTIQDAADCPLITYGHDDNCFEVMPTDGDGETYLVVVQRV